MKFAIDIDRFPLVRKEFYESLNIRLMLEHQPDPSPSRLDRPIADLMPLVVHDAFADLEAVEPLIAMLPDRLSAVVLRRWKSIIAASQNRFDDALEMAQEALIEARDLDKWIIRDIWFDVGNTAMIKQGYTGKYGSEILTSARAEISALNEHKFNPLVDPGLSRAHTLVCKHMFKHSIEHPLTITLGDDLPDVLDSLAESLIGAIVLGSNTCMHRIRHSIAHSMYAYRRTRGYSGFVPSVIGILTAEYDVSTIRKLFVSEWEAIHDEVPGSIQALCQWIPLPDNLPQNRVMKCLYIEELGAYLPDDRMPELQGFLLACVGDSMSMNYTFDVKRAGIRALCTVVNRLSVDDILDTILVHVDSHPLVLAELVHLLRQIDWSQVDSDLATQVLCGLDRVKGSIHQEPDLLKVYVKIRSAHPGLLRQVDSEAFAEWEANEHVHIAWHLSHPAAHISKDQARHVVDGLLRGMSLANGQVNENSPLGIGGYSYSHIVANLLINHDLSPWPEVWRVLMGILVNPYQAGRAKCSVAEAMTRLARHDSSISNQMKQLIGKDLMEKHEEILCCREDGLFIKNQRDVLDIRLRGLFLVIGLNKDVRSVIARCMELGLRPDLNLREASMAVIELVMSECDAKYLDTVCQFIFARTFDPWYQVRGDAIMLFASAVEKSDGWDKVFGERAKGMLSDSSVYVRSSVIEAVAMLYTKNILARESIAVLCEAALDPHFALRRRAKKLADDFGLTMT